MNATQVSISWLHGHPLTVMLILFLASCVVSLYAAEIKQFLRVWPAKKLNANMRDRLERRLRRLQRVKNNSYELLLDMAFEITRAIWWLLWMTVALFLVEWIEWAIDHNVHPSIASVWSMASGLLVGRAVALYEFLGQLYDYENTVTGIEKELAKLKALPEGNREQANVTE